MVNHIKALREQQGITISALARMSGVSRATISKIESGNAQARTTRTLEKIANALQCPLNEVFTFDRSEE